MAAVTLTLKVNPTTHERTLVIHYESDSDLLPFEHELEHKQWVEKLLGQPLHQIADAVDLKRIPPRNAQRVHIDSESISSDEHAQIKTPKRV